MDLEDLLKGRRHHSHAPHDYHYRGHRHGSHPLDMIKSIISVLPHKKALLTGLIIIGILIVVLCIAVVWLMLPFLSVLLDLVQDKGILGVLEALNSVIQKIWKGNG